MRALRRAAHQAARELGAAARAGNYSRDVLPLLERTARKDVLP